MKRNRTIDTKSVSGEVLSAKDFLELTKKNPKNIKTSSPVPPKLGATNFGCVYVEYFTPVYKMA